MIQSSYFSLILWADSSSALLRLVKNCFSSVVATSRDLEGIKTLRSLWKEVLQQRFSTVLFVHICSTRLFGHQRLLPPLTQLRCLGVFAGGGAALELQQPQVGQTAAAVRRCKSLWPGGGGCGAILIQFTKHCWSPFWERDVSVPLVTSQVGLSVHSWVLKVFKPLLWNSSIDYVRENVEWIGGKFGLKCARCWEVQLWLKRECQALTW